MADFNDIGISRQLDWPRIKKLLTMGFLASLGHLAADFLLAWGREDESLSGVLRMLSAYTAAPDGALFAAALLGLVSITLEGLCLFGVYRLIAAKSPESAHRYRAGIFGYVIFCGCGFHVPVCAMAFLYKHGLADGLLLKYAAYFLLPAFLLFWVFFLILEITQIHAFAKGRTPYPRWCWGLFHARGDGGGHGGDGFRQPSGGQRHFLRLDRHRKPLDVRRSPGRHEKGPLLTEEFHDHPGTGPLLPDFHRHSEAVRPGRRGKGALLLPQSRPGPGHPPGLISREEMVRRRKIFMTAFYLVMLISLVLILVLWNRVEDLKTAYLQALLFLEVMNWYDGLVIDKLWVGRSPFWKLPGIDLPYAQTWPQMLRKRLVLSLIWAVGAVIPGGLALLF